MRSAHSRVRLCTLFRPIEKRGLVDLSFLLVETTGVEPVSENPLTRLSPQAVRYLKFPSASVNEHTLASGSPFVLDRLKGERPMQVHRLFDAPSKSAVLLIGTGGLCHSTASVRAPYWRAYLSSQSNSFVVVYFLSLGS